MLYDEHGRAEFGRQFGKNGSQRGEATGRSADHDDPEVPGLHSLLLTGILRGTLANSGDQAHMKKRVAGEPGITVVGIGASAGGIEALREFFGALPVDLGLAYVVVVHLAPDHESELAGILARCTKMPVFEVRDDKKLDIAANTVFVVAPDRKLEIETKTISASAFHDARERRAAIDVFFRSLAQTHGDGFAVI